MSGIASIAPVAAEVLKLVLQGYFSYARQLGLSKEEADQLYNDQKAEFEKNNPADIPDV